MLIRVSHLLLLIIFIVHNASSQHTQIVKNPEVKYNPGHYVAVGPHINLSEITHLNKHALRGVNKRYHWRILEPNKDEYDLSSIERDLAFCSSQNKQLIVFLCDKSFWKKGALPTYLKKYELPYPDGTFNPIRWDPEFISRYIAMAKAIGERFNAHPNLEGVAIQESSLDLSEDDYIKYNYTPEKYRDALITILNGLQNALPQCKIFWYQNGIHKNSGHLRQIADSMSGSNVVMGGPDILPYRRWLRHTYKIYGEYKDDMTLFCSAQDDSYHHHKNDIRLSEKEPIHEEGFLTMENIFLYAQQSLYVKYIFWNYYYEEIEEDDQSFDDAIEVIQKYPTFNVTH